MRSVGRLWSIALLCAALGACKEQGMSGEQLRAANSGNDKARETAASAATDVAPLTADTVFSRRCATCHGTQGHGDGPAAQALKPRPRDYSDASWQKSVTDAQIKKAIIEGGAAVGKSSLMGPNADLAEQPEVLDGLVSIIRGFSADAPPAAAAAPRN